jgi:ubiquinone/menaquinone biosynthesis C-methylase UbiE
VREGMISTKTERSGKGRFMTTFSNQNSGDNDYVLGAENAAEMARIMDQDKLTNESMGGLFPERRDHLENIHTILDVACGPGGWVHEVARAYPHIDITGIDISAIMVEYANAHARVNGLANAHFQVMNALESLNFPDNAFDLINSRFLLGFMSPPAWPKLVQQCMRNLRPGGTLRMTESEGFGIINTPAMGRLNELSLRATYKAGRSFIPEGRSYGITAMLERYLREAGFAEIHTQGFAFNYSAGADLHESWCQNFITALQIMRPFMTQMIQVVSAAEFDDLVQQAQIEMLSDEFIGLSYSLMVWGTKPAA